jgi:hypothetical protein
VRTAALRAKHADRLNAESRTKRAANPLKYLVQQAGSRARRLGLDFDLTEADLTLPATCPVFGIPLVVGAGRKHDGSPSLDRVDNSRGYTKDNTVVVSFRANRAKNDLSLAELQTLVRFYETLQ